MVSVLMVNSASSSRQATMRMIGAMLTLVAALIAFYLLLAHLSIAPLVCPTTGCEKVQTSQYSMVFGVPVAAFGLAFYLVLMGLQVTGLTTNRVFGLRLEPILVTLSVLGVLTYAPLTYLELYVIHAVCFWCVTSSILMVGVLLANWVGRRP